MVLPQECFSGYLTFESAQYQDCTDIIFQRALSLLSQSVMCSDYRHHATYKGLLKIAHFRAITFITELHEGTMSFKEIAERMSMVNNNPWNEINLITAETGFTI